jgi:hypothetical protein
METTALRPERHEAAPYYFKYIDRVPDGDVCAILDAQLDETLAFLKTISEEQSRHRYAPDKWSVAEVVGHINDTERVFAFRAFWFAREQELALPSMEPEVAAAHSGADARPWSTHVAEFAALRASTLELFRNLPAEAWPRQGIASDNPFTVRAIAFILTGHVIHHIAILRERYLLE